MKENILIVEDELLIAEDIKMNLQQLHYKVSGIAIKADEALDILNNKNVDLALLDINIKGELDGIELGKKIKDQFNIPIVYLTSNSDKRTLQRAIETQPSGYVVKPYNKTDLLTTLAVALGSDNFDNDSNSYKSKGSGEFGFFKINGNFTKIDFNSILYFRTAGNYIEIHTDNDVSLVRLTVKELFELVSSGNFIRVHKSYILNTDRITECNSKEVCINGKSFPVGGIYKEEVFKALGV